MRIIWDDKKNQDNIKKHKISFMEAVTVFYDANAKIISARKATKKEAKNYGG